MTKGYGILAGMSLVWNAHGPTAPAEQAARAGPFARASVHLELNTNDRDMEAVFEVDGGWDGLTRLMVAGPDGRTVIDFTAPGAGTLGLRQFRLESPEPQDIGRLQAAYPAGAYTFTGTTTAGRKLVGRSTLTHALPAGVRDVRPAEAGAPVGAGPVAITWTSNGGAVSYVVTIEQEGAGGELSAKLPAPRREFLIPDGFLQPGVEYRLAIGAVAAGGNMSVVESAFATAGTD